MKLGVRLIEEYEEYLKLRNYAPATIEKYIKAVEVFTRFIEKEKGIKRVQEVTKKEIKEYQGRVYGLRRERDRKPVSLSRKAGLMGGVKSYFKFLIKAGYILYNPASDIEMPRVRRDKIMEVLKEREIRKILSNAKGESPLELRDRAMLEVLYSTGMRNTEMRELCMQDIDPEREEIRIRKGKGQKERVVPLGRIAAGWIDEYIKEAREGLKNKDSEEYLFLSVRGRKLTIGMPNKIVKKYAKRAKIKKKVKTHMIRHTCATHLLKGGADIRYVQELLGHDSLDTTVIYTKVEIGDLKRAHRKSHPRERWI